SWWISLRLRENSFDEAHQPYVPRNRLGEVNRPQPFDWNIDEHAWGFRAVSQSEVVNRDISKQVLRIDAERTTRTRNSAWWLPFNRRLGSIYPKGLNHGLITCATPIEDERSMIVQFVFRNDTETQVPTQAVIAFDRQVTLEDKFILESTDPDVPLDSSGERNMPSDKPGLIMRRKLLDLLHAHGETEVRRAGANLLRNS